MELAFILVFFLLILLFDFRVVLERNNSKEIYFYAVVLLFSLLILVLRSLEINLPDPSQLLLETTKTFFHYKLQL